MPKRPPPLVYFAHPINTYGTPLEVELQRKISRKFRHATVINPGDATHEEVVREMKKSDPTTNVMGYFVGLVHSCNALVALPFLDGMWGAGVFKEALIAHERGLTVWEIDPITKKISKRSSLPTDKMLSIEETRSRVYFPDRSLRAYAHFA